MGNAQLVKRPILGTQMRLLITGEEEKLDVGQLLSQQADVGREHGIDDDRVGSDAMAASVMGVSGAEGGGGQWGCGGETV